MSGVAPRNGQTRVTVAGDFGKRLCERLGLNPYDVLVGGFRVDFRDDRAMVTYRLRSNQRESQRMLPSAAVVALMED